MDSHIFDGLASPLVYNNMTVGGILFLSIPLLPSRSPHPSPFLMHLVILDVCPESSEEFEE